MSGATAEEIRSSVRAFVCVAEGTSQPEGLPLAHLDGVRRYGLVAGLETRFAVEFPADLLGVLESVDDLIHYTTVLAGHRI